MAACIGEPISWLRLEHHALHADTAVDRHLVDCAACRQCLDEIRDDVVALPALAAPGPRRQSWWRWAIPALAAAAIAMLVLRPRKPDEQVTRVKGIGQVVLDVVRERGGVVRDDVRSFAPGDRWKLIVTCPPERGAWLDLAVVDGTAPPFGDAAGRAQVPPVDASAHPLAPMHITCGNRVVVPGAFELTGANAQRVCVRIASDAPPADDAPAACVTISPQ